MSVQRQQYAPTLLRLILGLLFIIPGIQKLVNPGMIIGLLDQLGLPAPSLLGWILLLAEIIFGAAVLLGWKLEYTVWPLVIILGVAILTVHIPAWLSNQPMGLVTVLFHLLGIAALVSLNFMGPGVYGLKQS